LAGSKDQTINRVIIQNGLDRQFVLYWYQSHGRIVASEYWSKFYLVADAMRLNRTDGSIVRVVTPIRGEGEEAEQRAETEALRFVREMFPLLNDYLPS
jgi:EpsI family protein